MSSRSIGLGLRTHSEVLDCRPALHDIDSNTFVVVVTPYDAAIKIGPHSPDTTKVRPTLHQFDVETVVP